MKSPFKTHEFGVSLFGAGGALWLLSRGNHTLPQQVNLWAVLICCAFAAIACLRRHALARPILGMAYAALAVWFIQLGITSGWTIIRGLLLATSVWFAWLMFFEQDEETASDGAEDSAEEDESPMTSIVALVKELPYLDDTVLTRHVENAWDLTIDSHDDDATTFVIGEAPLFIVKTEDHMFMVHYHSTPYFESQEEAANASRDLRVCHVIESHAAWFSVDLMSASDNEADRPAEYSMLGRLIAEMTDSECLGLLLPAFQSLLPWEAEFAAALVSGNPLQRLCPENLPVVRVDGDDPRMVAAVSEARQSFSQFERAFEDRDDDDQSFAVKAPVTFGDNTEFIWITVTGIENGVIYGNLANEPVNLGRLKEGDRVRVKVAELNDWMFSRDDGFEGGFTVKVLGDIYAERDDDSRE